MVSIVVVLLIIACVISLGGGGYYIYTKRAKAKPSAEAVAKASANAESDAKVKAEAERVVSDAKKATEKAIADAKLAFLVKEKAEADAINSQAAAAAARLAFIAKEKTESEANSAAAAAARLAFIAKEKAESDAINAQAAAAAARLVVIAKEKAESDARETQAAAVAAKLAFVAKEKAEADVREAQAAAAAARLVVLAKEKAEADAINAQAAAAEAKLAFLAKEKAEAALAAAAAARLVVLAKEKAEADAINAQAAAAAARLAFLAKEKVEADARAKVVADCNSMTGTGPIPATCLDLWYKNSGCTSRFETKQDTIESTRLYIQSRGQALDIKSIQECHGTPTTLQECGVSKGFWNSSTSVCNLYKNPQGQTLLSRLSGLVGHYNASSFIGIEWSDLSGKGNHAKVVGKVVAGDGELTGGLADGIIFPPAILPDDFTLFYVAGYRGDDVANHKRIFDSTVGNNLFGFYNKKAGLTHLGTWMTDTAGNKTRNMMATHTDRVTRDNGVDISKIGSTALIPTGSIPLTINAGKYTAEKSTWGVGEVIVFNRKLPVEEMKIVEDYLRIKFNY